MRSCFLYIGMLLSTTPAHADVVQNAFSELADLRAVPHGDLAAFFEFHTNPATRDFGSGMPLGETPRKLGVECGVLTDTAPVAQWIARPPPKGQVAGSIPARGTNFSYSPDSVTPAALSLSGGVPHGTPTPRIPQ